MSQTRCLNVFIQKDISVKACLQRCTRAFPKLKVIGTLFSILVVERIFFVLPITFQNYQD